MHFPDITEKLLSAKKQKGLSFAELGKIVGRDEVWVAALLYRQAVASRGEAEKLATALGLGPEIAEWLTEYTVRGLGPAVPVEPVVYRFYEILQVYGMPLKALIHEKFGDGIMSAVDLAIGVDKEKDPHGDRVRITLSGKFLPYKKW